MQNPALQAHFLHILQFEENFEDNNMNNDHFENQPFPYQVEEPAQPIPAQPQIQQRQPVKRGRPPKQKEEDQEYRPKSVTPVQDPNFIARCTQQNGQIIFLMSQ